ncbi:MAG: DNA mismatch repair protein MutS [Firmicutes bacterium]|nr:DNA mismatch repair protein MutS [Bacillota bacterium]
MNIVTPMMRQYQAVKEQYSDCLLFFRMGDFYEMFGDDAVAASRELEIVLTARDAGGGQKMPMCGVPYHAVDGYLAKLIAKGFKVAICEQVEDPKTAKGLVKRDVIRVVTPGTVVESALLDETTANYLAAVWPDKNGTAFGLAYTDISTGKFLACEFGGAAAREKLADELSRIRPAELLLPQELKGDELFSLRLLGNAVGSVSAIYDEGFVRNNATDLLKIHFSVASLAAIGMDSAPLAVSAAAAILDFLQQTQKRALRYIDNIQLYQGGDFMLLDASTCRNLELCQTIIGGRRKGSLLWVCDKTLTAMGARLLREWLEKPLLSAESINMRLDAVQELIDKEDNAAALRDQLRDVYDLQRLCGRVSYGTATPRDLAALRASLAKLPQIFSLLSRFTGASYARFIDDFDMLEDVYANLADVLAEEPPISAKDTGIIRPGHNAEIDELRTLTTGNKNWLLQLEIDEKEKTGIRNLKVGYNKVFGYYIEVSKAQTNLVPDNYIRKQTLVNGERYITPELKEMEDKILSAAERLASREYELFTRLREQTAAMAPRIRATADILAQIDVLQSLAKVAQENNYCRPLVDDSAVIEIKDGRHPMVEKIIGMENYVPNDTYLDRDSQQLMLITGPNMAGKSTYMRQVALCVLMARIGSFVPASSAHIGRVDRIFTRVGASDDLTGGQSTFMVEMTETANILRYAGPDSLVILDEIGRGTSTFDGMSIAWAVAEYLMKEEHAAKTLFATHYHELTSLAEDNPRIKNFYVAVKESNGRIAFLRKILPGGVDRSYGIQVAALAGLPQSVLKRAGEILRHLEAEKHLSSAPAAPMSAEPLVQLHPLIEKIATLDVCSLTPLQALNLLQQWQDQLKEEE